MHELDLANTRHLRIGPVGLRFAGIIREHGLLLSLIVAYAVALMTLGHLYGAADRVQLSLYSRPLYIFTLCLGVLYLCGRAVWLIIHTRPVHPIPAVLADLRMFLWPDRILIALPVLAFLPLFLSAFTSAKTLIPVIQPFGWDATFARWDEIVHGGQPWRLLQPLLGHSAVTVVLSWIYAGWVLVFYFVVLWQTFSVRDRAARMRFFLAFALAWVLLGTAGAIMFSSAGPCFYDKVADGPDPYVPLLAYLRQANAGHPVWTVGTQDRLWESHLNSETAMVTGITAMPSMHVSMAFLFFLAAWHHRLLRVLLGLFLVGTCLACVHLGWHYAVDAYAAIVGTWLIWWACGLAGRRRGIWRSRGRKISFSRG